PADSTRTEATANGTYLPRPDCLSPCRAEDRKRSELRAKHTIARTAEPAVQERGIDPAEVDGVLRVAVGQVAQVGIGAVQPRLDPRSEQEHRGGGAVIGAAAGVLRKTTPELRKDQHQRPAGVSRLAQVVEEGPQRVAHLAEQIVVCPELIGVRVEAVELGVVEARAEPRLDELRDQPQPACQAVELRVSGPSVLPLEDTLQAGAAGVGQHLRVLDEVEQRARAAARPGADRIKGGALLPGPGGLGDADPAAELFQVLQRRDVTLASREGLR